MLTEPQAATTEGKNSGTDDEFLPVASLFSNHGVAKVIFCLSQRMPCLPLKTKSKLSSLPLQASPCTCTSWGPRQLLPQRFRSTYCSLRVPRFSWPGPGMPSPPTLVYLDIFYSQFENRRLYGAFMAAPEALLPPPAPAYTPLSPRQHFLSRGELL